MNRHGMKAWLYLLPALLFLSIFMIYPLIDVFVYSAEEGYNFASQTYFGTGLYKDVYKRQREIWSGYILPAVSAPPYWNM